MCPTASRIPAQELGTDIALTDDGDIASHGGFVGGIEALPQKIRLCMSYQKGGSALFTDFGSRLSEFVALYSVSRVLSFHFLERGAIGEWWPASIELDVVGLGRWKNDLKIYVGEHPQPPPAPPSADPRNFSLAGPGDPDEPA